MKRRTVVTARAMAYILSFGIILPAAGMLSGCKKNKKSTSIQKVSVSFWMW